MRIEPRELSYKEFPASAAAAEGMKVLQMNPEAIYCTMLRNHPYCERDGRPLHMHLILPSRHECPDLIWPLLVYVKGSAWRQQNLDADLLPLSTIARQGYAVAIVEYRPSDIAPFPAQIQDTKTAIRYLRKNAGQFKIDPEQVVLWGDSSGGHTAVMAGITWQDKSLDTDVYSGYSSQVKGIIDYYGPTDITRMNMAHSTIDHSRAESPEGRLIGGFDVLKNPEQADPTIIMNHLSKEIDIPPILIIHGNKDRLVPFEQSVLLYNDLKHKGKDVDFYKIEGADHGGQDFWSDEVMGIILAFIKRL
jgi:acetyl esterase/lipase